MSLVATCGWTLMRSAAIVAFALPTCCVVRRLLLQVKGWQRRLAWAMLIAPLLAPHLVTGYGYANFSLSLVHLPVANELLYGFLTLVCTIPLGVIVLYFAPPPPVSREALHVSRLCAGRRLSLDGSILPRATSVAAGLWTRGPARHAILAVALMFLVCFQEFELASLMGVPSWTVWLFDAQAGGLQLSQSLRFAAVPLLCQLAILVPVCALSWRSFRFESPSRQSWQPLSTLSCWGVWLYLLAGLTMFCVIPWALVLGSALPGTRNLIDSFMLGGDITVGCLFAVTAGSAAYLVSHLLLGRSVTPLPFSTSRSRFGLAPLAIGISLPGLLGSLVLGLSVLCSFQLSPLHAAYDSPLPWFVGLLLFLLPRAMFLLLVLTAIRSREGEHMAGLLLASPRVDQKHSARELQWHVRWSMHFWALVLLCYWAYVDLTTAAILSPTSMVSAPVRLYNLMHYGQSSVLSAMVVATFGIPLVTIGCLLAFRRPLLRLVI